MDYEIIGQKSVKKNCTLYFGDSTAQGFVYKDLNTFYDPSKRDEICYIAEAGFDERMDFITDDEAQAEIEAGGATRITPFFKW